MGTHEVQPHAVLPPTTTSYTRQWKLAAHPGLPSGLSGPLQQWGRYKVAHLQLCCKAETELFVGSAHQLEDNGARNTVLAVWL